MSTWSPTTATALRPADHPDDSPEEHQVAGHAHPDAPGLTVTWDRPAGLWSVTHAASGYAVAWATTRPAAQQVALDLGAGPVDWTRPAPELALDRAAIQALATLAAMPGVTIERPPPVAPAA